MNIPANNCCMATYFVPYYWHDQGYITIPLNVPIMGAVHPRGVSLVKDRAPLLGASFLWLGSAVDISSARVAVENRSDRRTGDEGRCWIGLKTLQLNSMHKGWDKPLCGRSQPTILGTCNMANLAVGERRVVTVKGYTGTNGSSMLLNGSGAYCAQAQSARNAHK